MALPIGAPVHSTDGEKLGRIESIYYDNETNLPEWAATRTGLFRGHLFTATGTAAPSPFPSTRPR
jgi:hypothetical protein